MGGPPEPPDNARLREALNVAASIAAVVYTTTGGISINTIPIRVGARDTAQSGLELELVDLVLHISHTIAGNSIQNLLGLLTHMSIGSSGIVRHVKLHRINIACSIAATSSQLRSKSASVLEILVADLANGVIGLTSNSGLLIVQAANLILEFGKRLTRAKFSFSYRSATATPITKAAVAKQEQQSQEPQAIATEHSIAITTIAITISNRSDVSRSHTIHEKTFFHIFLLKQGLRTTLLKSLDTKHSSHLNKLSGLSG